MPGGDGTGFAGRFVASPRYLATFQPKQAPRFFTDILVIGSGLAGLRSALGVGRRRSFWSSAILLGKNEDMDDIVNAILKVHENKDKPKAV